MIDPMNITKYNRTQDELEEFILFCVLVAGKRATYIAQKLTKILQNLIARSKHIVMTPDGPQVIYRTKSLSPFALFDRLDNIPAILKENGIGCYNLKAKAIRALVSSNINLQQCTAQDLLEIPGIGYKTANFFLLHSRENSECVVLDTHILRWLRMKGYRVPKSTPSSRAQYDRLAKIFLNFVPHNKTVAEFDLEIWRNVQKGVYATT